DQGHQGPRLEGRRSRDGVQAHRIRAAPLADGQRPPPGSPGQGRGTLRMRCAGRAARGGSSMTAPTGTRPEQPIREGKYARVELERRFLLAGVPPTPAVTASRRITDRYLPGTRLRLRRVDHLDSGACQLKLTQKVPAGRPGYVQGLITNT